MPRQATVSITFRLTPVQMEQLKDAIGTTSDAWLGVSHHVRTAVLNWARGTLSARKQLDARTRAASIRRAVEGKP